MIDIRCAADRTVTYGDGITTRHGFSSGAHYDPANLSFGRLVAHDLHVLAPEAAPRPACMMRRTVMVLDEALSEAPALLLTGPRASGKTTTAARRSDVVVRLDRPAEAAAFHADPDAALRRLDGTVLLDEWQAVPEILGAVKRSVDENPAPGRFLLTGSVRAQRDPVLWPGTGRLVRVSMWPMCVRELRNLGESTDLTPDASLLGRVRAHGIDSIADPADTPDLPGYLELAVRGGMPHAALNLSERGRRRWYVSYLDQVSGHDAAGLGEAPDPRAPAKSRDAEDLQ